MSSGLTLVRAALETALNAMTPALATVWQNMPYTPVVGTAYQEVFLMPATPANPTFGNSYYREQGVMQINLCYPIQTGAGAAEARAELIRATFKRGTSFTSGAVTVIIETTPEIMQGRREGDNNETWCVPVRVRWFAGIQ